MSMDPDVRTDWIAALRSGKYAQAQGALCKPGGYCCLGVLVEASFPELWIDDNERGIFRDLAENEYGDDIEGPVNGGELGHEFLKQIGLEEQDEKTLIDMNDNEGCDFDHIATFIENNV